MFKFQNCQCWLQLKDDAEIFNGISRKASWDLALNCSTFYLSYGELRITVLGTVVELLNSLYLDMFKAKVPPTLAHTHTHIKNSKQNIYFIVIHITYFSTVNPSDAVNFALVFQSLSQKYT